MKEFEWFEWFEWFGPSPIEPFNSAPDEVLLDHVEREEHAGFASREDGAPVVREVDPRDGVRVDRELGVRWRAVRERPPVSTQRPGAGAEEENAARRREVDGREMSARELPAPRA